MTTIGPTHPPHIQPPTVGPIGGGLPWERGGGAVPYNFSAYATPSLHLYAPPAPHGTITETGLGVSAWTDLAGVWTVVQGTDADRPDHLAAGGVDFDLANTECLDLSGGSVSGGKYTLFADVDIGSASGLMFFLEFNNGGSRLIFEINTDTNKLGFFDGAHRSVTNAAGTGRQKLRWVYNGGVGGEVFKDGASQGTCAIGNVSPGTTTAARISEATTAATAYCDVTVYRMIFYQTASLSAAQCAEIEANL
jgi:hypothetical protein